MQGPRRRNKDLDFKGWQYVLIYKLHVLQRSFRGQ